MTVTSSTSLESTISVVAYEEDTVTNRGLALVLDLPDMRFLGSTDDIDELFRMIAESTVDAVIVDLRVHDDPENGLEVLRRLRLEAPRARRIVLTALGRHDAEPLKAAYALHPDVFMAKAGHPTQPSLADVIRSAMRGFRYFDKFLEEIVDGTTLASQDNPFARLTERQLDVVLLVAEGLTNQEIAERLVISVHTVRGHVEEILRVLELRNRHEVADLARRHPPALRRAEP